MENQVKLPVMIHDTVAITKLCSYCSPFTCSMIDNPTENFLLSLSSGTLTLHLLVRAPPKEALFLTMNQQPSETHAADTVSQEHILKNGIWSPWSFKNPSPFLTQKYSMWLFWKITAITVHWVDGDVVTVLLKYCFILINIIFYWPCIYFIYQSIQYGCIWCMDVYACTTQKPKVTEFAVDIRLFRLIKTNKDKGEKERFGIVWCIAQWQSQSICILMWERQILCWARWEGMTH